jgi:hypothetical protein
MKKSLLLPREKYFESERKWGESPLTLVIESSDQKLFYFGANHSKDPNNKQYPILKDFWGKFLEKIDVKNSIVLVEGGLRRVFENEQEAILDRAEGNLITIYATNLSIKIESPDIPLDDAIKSIPEITREQFFLYIFLSWFSNYQRYPDPKPDFETEYLKWSKRFEKKQYWNGFDTGVQNMKIMFKNILKEEFSLEFKANDYINPNRSESIINEIARKHSDARDLNIASEIEKYWNEGKSIFVVFGSGHLIIQEPALRELLK